MQKVTSASFVWQSFNQALAFSKNMNSLKWVAVFLCFYCFSYQSSNATITDSSTDEEELFNLLVNEITSTQNQMSQFASRHPELYGETQMWKTLSQPEEVEDEIEISESTSGDSSNFTLTIPLKANSVFDHSLRLKLDQCLADLFHFGKSLSEMWAIKMLDSFGKPSSGLLTGQIRWVGSYDECLEVVAPLSSLSQMGFRGRYAWLSFTVNSTSPASALTLVGALQVGVCLPSSCAQTNQVGKYYKELIKILKLVPFVNKVVEKLPVPKVTFIPETQPLSSPAKACIAICSIFAVLVIVGSLLDVLKRKKLIGQPVVHSETSLEPKKYDEGEPSSVHLNNSINLSHEQQAQATQDDVRLIIETPKNWGTTFSDLTLDFFLCFSAITNGMAILDTSGTQGQLQCLHGIRFISMAWVMLGHTYVFGVGSISNLKDVFSTLQTWPFQVVLQGTVSVDTFFLLSGCLLTYLFLKNENQLNSVGDWVSFYVHRYVRLTPVYAIMIFVFATWWNDISNGPFWSDVNRDMCAKSWWQNLLYINNFYTSKNMCFGWAWYLANDMQFFVISPLFLFAFRRNRKFGLAVVTLLLFASWLTTGVLSRVRNWKVMFQMGGNSTDLMNADEQMRFFDELYQKPYTRIGPYLIGVLLGYTLIELKDQKGFMHKGLVALGWVASQSLSLIILYGLLHANLGPITTSAYNALTRSAWGMSVAWVIFACLTGHAGPVDTILSWKAFIPLSRLTYCAYLVHPMVMYWYYNSMMNTFFFNNSIIVINYLAFVVLSYGVAFIASLLFESPIIKLEKLLKKKR